MNKIELQKKLIFENIGQDMYSLKGGVPNEAYCLTEVGGQREVYYSERGNKTGLKIFEAEEDACQYFYDWAIRVLKK